MKTFITAGLLVKGEVRRYLLRNGFNFTEDKGILTSEFYINCTKEQYNQILKDINQYETI